MSNTADGAVDALSTPRSSKKRKVATTTPETSKKKRKHERLENGITDSQETEAPKKDKKHKKKRKKAEHVEAAPQSEEDDDDVEIPVVPAETNVVGSSDEAADDEPVADEMEVDGFVDLVEEIDDTMLQSAEPSCFYEKRLSLQVPIPAISLISPTSSLLSLHLAPLLLTYFPPAEGIVLSFSDPILSAKPRYGVNLSLQAPTSGEIPKHPPDETFARCADGFGVCWVWLTATFLVFRPSTGDQLKGWTNVTSEGFVGLVSYNYFQTAIGKTRIPKTWIWDGPTRESTRNKKKARIGKLRDEDGVDNSQEMVVDSQTVQNGNDFTEGGSGSFVDADGMKVSAGQTFQVVDVEMVPGHERDKWTLQIDGSLLSTEEEAAVMAEEKQRFEQIQHRSRSRSKTPGVEPGEMPIMSGALSFSRQPTPA